MGPFIICSRCSDVIRSRFRHDFVTCKCGKTFVDGGAAYCRVGGYPVHECGQLVCHDDKPSDEVVAAAVARMVNDYDEKPEADDVPTDD